MEALKNGIELTGTLYTSAQGDAKDKLAYAEQIWDNEQQKHQSEINKEIFQSVGTILTADELDITVKNNKLQFKDRDNTDGMGYVILRKDIPLVSQMTKENTIYEIRYEFDLNKQTLAIPNNSVLKFIGGNIHNGTIVGNNTGFENIHKGDCLCRLSGTFKGQEINIDCFNTTNDDITNNLQCLVNSYNKIIINNGLWFVSKPIILRSNIEIKGESNTDSKISITVDTYNNNKTKVCIFSNSQIVNSFNTYGRHGDGNHPVENVKISNIGFDLNRHPDVFETMTAHYCVVAYVEDSNNITIDGCKIIDYMTEGLSSEGKNNGGHAIILYNTTNSAVHNCYTQNVTFVYLEQSSNITISENKGINTIGTWIETLQSPNCFITKNNIENIYWASSMIGINSKNTIIDNNIIKSSNNIYHASGITLGHNVEGKDADNSVVKNNTIIQDICAGGIQIQNGSNIIIDNNNIEVTAHKLSKENLEESWVNYKYEYGAAILCENYNADENSIIVIKNNIITDKMLHGIQLKNNIVYNISNNVITGYTTGIYSSVYPMLNIRCNIINSDYASVNLTATNTRFNSNIVTQPIILPESAITYIQNNMLLMTRNLKNIHSYCINVVNSNTCFVEHNFIASDFASDNLLPIGIKITTTEDNIIDAYDITRHNTYNDIMECGCNVEYFIDGKKKYGVSTVPYGYKKIGYKRSVPLEFIHKGFRMFDTEIDKPIIWDGIQIMNEDGTYAQKVTII